MSEQSTNGIDREGVGMLYAGGAGIMVGSSVANGLGPPAAPLLGSAVVICGLSYELYQRYVHAGNSRQGDDS